MRVEFTVTGRTANDLRKKADEVLTRFADEGEWVIESFDARAGSGGMQGQEWIAEVSAWDGREPEAPPD